VIERSLYNGLISGLSLDGKKFFYPNALESDGVYKFNRGECTRQSWFDCSCCPTNLIRFIPSIPGLIYSTSKDVLYVNLYASNTAKVALDKNNLEISQQTNYPWDGKVSISVTPKTEVPFTIKLRIPSWARNQVLPGDLYHYKNTSTAKTIVTINGKRMDYTENKGYITITKKWKKGETIVLDFPMEVKEVVTNTKVEGNIGKVALEYGPIVYAIEEADNATIVGREIPESKKVNEIVLMLNSIVLIRNPFIPKIATPDNPTMIPGSMYLSRSKLIAA
jgi:DUF1680 family protein